MIEDGAVIAARLVAERTGKPTFACPYSKLRKPKKSWSFLAFGVLSRDRYLVTMAWNMKRMFALSAG
jgi:hypothetical protein